MWFEEDAGLETLLRTVPSGALELERIFPGLADCDTSFALINRYATDNPRHARGFRAGQWFETTQAVYWHFLECVPPLYMTSGGFVVGECKMGDLYESFLEIDGRYFCAVLAWSGPQSFSALWSALVAEVAS